ncbi:hypothetical protein KC19_6G046000 [Ceratodon purpureus]|uniref:Uncharacterized protein n=1 Tax=Ceratodon purpureus TaxID=3225 RepID=A0A8T0HAA6_CERPU|nr:hypothetical protein KC19_6G046000 [Ceratodon purpureus]
MAMAERLIPPKGSPREPLHLVHSPHVRCLDSNGGGEAGKPRRSRYGPENSRIEGVLQRTRAVIRECETALARVASMEFVRVVQEEGFEGEGIKMVVRVDSALNFSWTTIVSSPDPTTSEREQTMQHGAGSGEDFIEVDDDEALPSEGAQS